MSQEDSQYLHCVTSIPVQRKDFHTNKNVSRFQAVPSIGSCNYQATRDLEAMCRNICVCGLLGQHSP
eukprot:5794253-Amphidinium_carterae.1